MKISIITFHNTSNFGATLQCTALFKYLKNSGHDVEIVNYLPDYIRNKKSATKELKNAYKAKNKVKAITKGLAYLAHYGELKHRDDCFESFLSKNISLTQVYSTTEQIVRNPPQADLYICGSDQIWNPALTGGKPDEAFFLCYAKDNKVSYGASMGEFDVEGNAEVLKKLTKDFKMVSLREKYMADRLTQVIGMPVKTVLDCTLLLDDTDYAQYEEPVDEISSPYLLYYNMQKSSLADDMAKRIAEALSLDVVDISPNPFLRIKGSKKLIDIGPGEFLTLFKNAQYVVTNSFHGTAFSILYKKQFVCTLHSTRGGRVLDLLTSLGLSNRIIKNTNEVFSEIIDYESVYSTLRALRTESYTYLQKALEDI